MIAGNSCIDSCKGQAPGFYQLCDTCKEYLQCKNRGSNTLSCKGNLKWNPAKGKCTAKSKCKVMTTVPPTTTTPATTTTSTGGNYGKSGVVIIIIIMVSSYIAYILQCSVRFSHIIPGHWTCSFMYHFNIEIVVFFVCSMWGGRVGPLEKKSVLINDFLVKSQLIYFDT